MPFREGFLDFLYSWGGFAIEGEEKLTVRVETRVYSGPEKKTRKKQKRLKTRKTDRHQVKRKT